MNEPAGHSKYSVSEKGFYGDFGGAYIPEMLYPNVKELEENYLRILNSEKFQTEFRSLLKDYVGRPSPLYFAKRLSEKYTANSLKSSIFVKLSSLRLSLSKL